jgi:palmitoyltransferase
MGPNGGGLVTDQTRTQERGMEADTPIDSEAGVSDAFPHPSSSRGIGRRGGGIPEPAPSEQRQKNKNSKRSRTIEKEKPRVHVERRPWTTPILRPEHRYCGLDEIVKPYRTHHCRACGTVRSFSPFVTFVETYFVIDIFVGCEQCVLKFDHHCPCASVLS